MTRHIYLAQGAEMKILGGNLGKGINKPLKDYKGPLKKSSRFFQLETLFGSTTTWGSSQHQKQADAVNAHRQGCDHLTQTVCMVKSS